MKVLHLPTEVGGNAWGLAQAERRLGFDSSVLVAKSGWFGYPADIKLGLERTNSIFVKLYKLTQAFFNARNDYDILHFNFGSTLFHSLSRDINLFDLPFYSENQRIFATYNGCDARQKDRVVVNRLFAPCFNEKCSNGMCNDGSIDQARRNSIYKMSQYAKHIWALNPDLLDFLPESISSFLPYTVNPPFLTPKLPSLSGKLKIVHAPTNRIIKGTEEILDALRLLKSSHGDCFEIILVEGKSITEALKIYQQADLIIDQLLIGWYGGIAVESMLLAKPVVCYINSSDLARVPVNMATQLASTVINANTSNIYDALVWCVENRRPLRELGKNSVDYANKWHSPSYVAEITCAAYQANYE